MASRQEEKEARRKARLEQEQKERKAEARRKRLQMVLGGVLVVGIVAGIVVALLAGGGDSAADGDGPRQATSASDVNLPEQQETDVQAAAEAAGCELSTKPNEGNGHADKEFKPADYEQNPPTSGTHFPEWAQDGIYEPGNTPPLGELVHTLEHGRINVQYKPGAGDQLIRQLEGFVAENGGYHMVLYENTTGMDAQLAATAWDQQLLCPSVNDKTWDALRTFRDRYLDKGPEQVP